MDTAIIVCLITSVCSVLSGIATFIFNRVAKAADHKQERKDKAEDRHMASDSKQDCRIALLEADFLEIRDEIREIGNKLNEYGDVQMMLVNGLGLVVDAMEVGGMNGEGKEYLRNINDYYVNKGKEAMKFQCDVVSKEA